MTTCTDDKPRPLENIVRFFWPWGEIRRLRRRIRAIPFEVTDKDLCAANRTEAQFWKLLYLQQYRETRNAHKGIERLRKKLNRKSNAVVSGRPHKPEDSPA